jgi:hypothetical protein
MMTFSVKALVSVSSLRKYVPAAGTHLLYRSPYFHKILLPPLVGRKVYGLPREGINCYLIPLEKSRFVFLVDQEAMVGQKAPSHGDATGAGFFQRILSGVAEGTLTQETFGLSRTRGFHLSGVGVSDTDLFFQRSRLQLLVPGC